MDLLNVEQILLRIYKIILFEIYYYLLNGSSFQTQNILGKYKFNILKL